MTYDPAAATLHPARVLPNGGILFIPVSETKVQFGTSKVPHCKDDASAVG
jgi:hypothetical protein